MISIELLINNDVGLHARPAVLFTQEAQKYNASIFLGYEGRRANAKNALEIMGLRIGPFATITLTTSGADESAALEGLRNLVESNFDETE